MERIALFAGTFDPYTRGHHDLVMRALSLFDKVVVAVGCNIGKQCMYSVEERVAAIENVYMGNARVSVVSYSGLTVDVAHTVGATALLRGVRSVKDFEYEREIAEVNRLLNGIETVLLMCAPEYASLSSSVVRELIGYGKDVSSLLP